MVEDFAAFVVQLHESLLIRKLSFWPVFTYVYFNFGDAELVEYFLLVPTGLRAYSSGVSPDSVRVSDSCRGIPPAYAAFHRHNRGPSRFQEHAQFCILSLDRYAIIKTYMATL